MTVVLKSGSSYYLSEASHEVYNKLPPLSYVVKKDKGGNLFLEENSLRETPVKLYGDVESRAKRILSTYFCRDSSTGVMLLGEKGSGKTLLARKISFLAQQEDIPTIIVNNSFCGDDFNSLIAGISQPCVIVFDEFEKVYDREDQANILTLLDGTINTKKLFIFTCNDYPYVSAQLINRPGRIYYFFEFKGLTQDFVTDYCSDNLNDKSQLNSILVVSSVFLDFNFDMLQAIVEEMNRYDEPAQTVLQYLNVRQSHIAGSRVYKISVFYGGKEIKLRNNETEIECSPLQDVVHTYFEETDNTDYLELFPKYITKVIPNQGIYEYQKDGFTIILTEQKRSMWSYHNLIA